MGIMVRVLFRDGTSVHFSYTPAEDELKNARAAADVFYKRMDMHTRFIKIGNQMLMLDAMSMISFEDAP